MNFGLNDEQELLVEAARGTLSRVSDTEAVRAAIDGAPLPDLWSVACEAGWPGLLVAEKHGGAELGALEAALVMAELGRALTSIPVLGHFAATALLVEAGFDDDLLAEIASGEKRAAYLPARPPSFAVEHWTSDPQQNTLQRSASPTLEGPDRVSGSVYWAPDAAGADIYVVPAYTAGKTAIALVAADSEGLAVTPVQSYDPTRQLAHVELNSATTIATQPIEPEQLAYPWYLSQSLLAAEALGGSEFCLELAVAYAKERFTFGRAIGSYQAIKHRLVEVLRRNENLRSLIYFVGYASEAERDQFPLAASSARTAGISTFDFATRTNIAVHGGIGATFEHEAPLYFRKAELSRRLVGGAEDAADRVGEILLAGCAQSHTG